MTPLWVGVDIGGTKVLAAVVDDQGRVVRSATLRTPGRRVEVAVVEDTLVAAVREVAAGAPLRGVGIAAAGFVDAEGERVMFAPHLPWRGERVRERLAARLQTPVELDNDANCAALAEATYGAARGARLAVMITLGTGIGGAVLIEGRVLRGAHGMAGEFGHMQVVPDGAPCECGKRGCWEQYSSGNALVRHVQQGWGRGPTLLEEMTEGDVTRLTGPMISQAAAAGDLVAKSAFASIGDWLGVGAANVAAALDPEVIVVGGGVSAAGERLLEPARAALARSLVGGDARPVPRLVPAESGPLSGAIGAAVLARTPTLEQ
ncbi:MAG: ROK family protein [Nocardioides sp.]|jgi:glucokinase